jgi:CAAX prenyl protease-like protein
VAALASVWPLLRPLLPVVWGNWGLRRGQDLPLLVWYVLVNPWIEEWFWRGALLGSRVSDHLGPGRARALAMLGFLPYHYAVLALGFGPRVGCVLALGVLLGSACWTAMRLRFGSAWWAAASHQGADLGLALVYWMRMRPPTG